MIKLLLGWNAVLTIAVIVALANLASNGHSISFLSGTMTHIVEALEAYGIPVFPVISPTG